MVQIMSPRKVAVKLDADESFDTQLGPIHKRLKLDSVPQVQVHLFSVFDFMLCGFSIDTLFMVYDSLISSIFCDIH